MLQRSPTPAGRLAPVHKLANTSAHGAGGPVLCRYDRDSLHERFDKLTPGTIRSKQALPLANGNFFRFRSRRRCRLWTILVI
jgi:hypothetical protein